MSDTTHLQQQEALALARRCAHILQQRFGARRVIPFGSFVGQGPWHASSDLDLAVEGLAPEQFFRAWAVLRELVPPHMGVDLIALEQAGEALRARILGEKPMAENPLRALKELVEDELATLGDIVRAVQEGRGSFEETPSQFALQALASYLHQFYTGCERILERIAVTVDGGPPRGLFACESAGANGPDTSRRPASGLERSIMAAPARLSGVSAFLPPCLWLHVGVAKASAVGYRHAHNAHRAA